MIDHGRCNPCGRDAVLEQPRRSMCLYLIQPNAKPTKSSDQQKRSQDRDKNNKKDSSPKIGQSKTIIGFPRFHNTDPPSVCFQILTLNNTNLTMPNIHRHRVQRNWLSRKRRKGCLKIRNYGKQEVGIYGKTMEGRRERVRFIIGQGLP